MCGIYMDCPAHFYGTHYLKLYLWLHNPVQVILYYIWHLYINNFVIFCDVDSDMVLFSIYFPFYYHSSHRAMDISKTVLLGKVVQTAPQMPYIACARGLRIGLNISGNLLSKLLGKFNMYTFLVKLKMKLLYMYRGMYRPTDFNCCLVTKQFLTCIPTLCILIYYIQIKW